MRGDGRRWFCRHRWMRCDRRSRGFLHRGLHRFRRRNWGRSLRFRRSLQRVTDLFRNINRNRAGVCLLFGYAEPGQQINNRLGFDLKLSGQFVNSDLG